MRFLIIETFHPGKIRALYERFRERGRMLPPGVTYVDSWIADGLDRCFQLMEADRPEAIDAWIRRWSDLADFEVVRVVSSEEAAGRVLGDREPPDR